MKLIIILLFISTNLFCQKPNVSVDGQGNFHPLTEQADSTDKYLITETGKFPVYRTSSGKLFIWRESKKTRKKYRFYLRTK